MARRKDHTRDELRALILEKAWHIIGKDGKDAITARRLAKEIGYTAGTLYNVFPCIDDVVLAINGRILDLLYNEFQHSMIQKKQGNKNLEQQLKLMADIYMKFSNEYRPYWMMLFLSQLPIDRYNQPWYHEKTERIFQPLELILKSSFPKANGQFIKQHARILWAAVHGICFLDHTEKLPSFSDTQNTKQAVQLLIKTYIEGLK